MRVLGIGAHPDDLEILAGGTLARMRSVGHEVWMCHVAQGDRGSASGSRHELSERRSREAIDSSQIIGATSLTLQVPDGEVFAGDEQQKLAMVDLIRQVEPELILTHSYTDYMEDHNQTAELAFSCSFLATVPLYETESAAMRTLPALIHMETLGGIEFEPTEFVDITDFIESKIAMMRSHASQLAWLDHHDHADVLEDILTTARYRGLQAGVKYAEAFRPSLRRGRARAARLLP